MIAFVQNTNLITLLRLRAETTKEVIDDAEVTVTILVPATRVEVAGQEWPLLMQPIDDSPPKGDYRGVLSDEIEFVANKTYLAVVEVDAGQGRKGHWEVPFVAKVRQ